MVFLTPHVTVKCSKCGSDNVAELTNEGMTPVCLDCGHRGERPKTLLEREMEHSNATVYKSSPPPTERTF